MLQWERLKKDTNIEAFQLSTPCGHRSREFLALKESAFLWRPRINHEVGPSGLMNGSMDRIQGLFRFVIRKYELEKDQDLGLSGILIFFNLINENGYFVSVLLPHLLLRVI